MTVSGRGSLIVILSQVFVPDPASVGQHIADVAFELVRRGFNVRVYTSDRGYDDPTQVYQRREWIQGVEVIRLPGTSFGKQSFSRRILATLSFMGKTLSRAVFEREVAGVIVSTSPPLIGSVGLALRFLRDFRFCYWVMDLNPDQLIASGALTARSLPAQLLGTVNTAILRHASLVVALDRFMADRLLERASIDGRLETMPPWPHEDSVAPVPHEENWFRHKHQLDGKFVVMYSGNHSTSNPLTTVLQAAVQLRHDTTIKFLFVGGGNGKAEVEAVRNSYGLDNLLSLSYQPLEALRYSLSAADLHVVTMGDNMVGIIHPCKVYGAMAVGRPVLYVGPNPSHISDLLDREGFGRHVGHGDVDGCVTAIRSVQALSESARTDAGLRGQQLVAGRLSQALLCARFCDAVEHALCREGASSQASRPAPTLNQQQGR